MNRPFYIIPGRVYIGCNEHSFDSKLLCSSREFIDVLAYSRPEKYIIGSEKCTNRIRVDVKDIANNYISDVDIRKSNTNLFSYVSKKQYNHLMKAFDVNTSSISCFSLVILTSAYDLLIENGYDKDKAKRLILRYIDYIHIAVMNSNENTEVSQYLLDCYLPVCDYINSDGVSDLELPPIPKILIAVPDNDA